MLTEVFLGKILEMIVPTLAGIAGIIVALRTNHVVEVDRARKKKQRASDLVDPPEEGEAEQGEERRVRGSREDRKPKHTHIKE